uniref:Uncharacterized protein n=1 Tax=Arundo donax TaxID=35708 RepID=A0A0A9EU54_ARUDO
MRDSFSLLLLRRGHMASSSSINIKARLPREACEYALEKSSRRNFSPSPTWALCTEYGLIIVRCAWHSRTIARTKLVFPVPGGP